MLSIHRIVGAAAVALALSPLVGLAQSPQQNQQSICITDCTLEYQNQVRACEGNNDKDACLAAADSAYHTCTAICPADR